VGASSEPGVRRGVVTERAPERAAGALADRLGTRDIALVVAFGSWRYPPHTLAAALADAFGSVPVIGCTSAGEIGGGCHDGALVGIALPASSFQVGVALATDLRRSALRSSRTAVVEAAAALGLIPEALDPARHAAIALVDGRSGVEESFCLGSAATAPQIRFVGGSASDDYESAPLAAVFHGGRAHRDAGVVAILACAQPFVALESEHMDPTEERVVVTAAEPEARLVHELNGYPAREHYQRLVRKVSGDPSPVDDLRASTYPFATYVGDRAYVRSVVHLEGSSLRFAAAVEAGAVLRLMRAGDLVGSTRAALAKADAELGGASTVLAFSCLGRHREAVTSGTLDQIAAVYDRHAVLGFHSFGEQTGPLLVNHTLTGLAFAGGRDG
jgi:hypothetical protein